MTVRNLDRLFQPRSIAVIGASKRPQSIGKVVSRNLFSAGFDGPVMAVNPHETSNRGRPWPYRSVADLVRWRPDWRLISTLARRTRAGDSSTSLGPPAAPAPRFVIHRSAFARAATPMGEPLMQRDAWERTLAHLLRIVGAELALGYGAACAGPTRQLSSTSRPSPVDIAFRQPVRRDRDPRSFRETGRSNRGIGYSATSSR